MVLNLIQMPINWWPLFELCSKILTHGPHHLPSPKGRNRLPVPMHVFVWSRTCGVCVGFSQWNEACFDQHVCSGTVTSIQSDFKERKSVNRYPRGKKMNKKNAKNQIWSKWKVCGLISCWNDKIYSQSAIWCRIKGASGWIWASWWICCEGNQGSSKTSPQRYLLHTPSFKKTLSCQNIEEHWMRNNNMRKSNPIWNHEITLLNGLFALDLTRPF